MNTNTLENQANEKGSIPPKRSVRLKTAFDVNRLLAKTINQLLRNEISESKVGKVGYLCNVMLKAFELTEIEQRITKLENQKTEGKRNEFNQQTS